VNLHGKKKAWEGTVLPGADGGKEAHNERCKRLGKRREGCALQTAGEKRRHGRRQSLSPGDLGGGETFL